LWGKKRGRKRGKSETLETLKEQEQKIKIKNKRI